GHPRLSATRVFAPIITPHFLTKPSYFTHFFPITFQISTRCITLFTIKSHVC
ncbi:hypothetical protein CSUI_006130, partial [Cystoisospora suis]